MHCATSQSTHHDPVAACNAAYTELTKRLGGAPEMLYIGWSVAYDSSVVAQEIVRLADGCPLHGATSCLGAMTEEGFISEDGRGIALFGIRDSGGNYGVGSAPIGDAPVDAAATALIQALDAAGRSGEAPALIRLSTPPGVEEKIIEGLENVLGPNVPIVGGSAADNTVEGAWQLLANGRLDADAVVVSVFFPGGQVATTFHSGYTPSEISGTVTSARGRIIEAIDGKPAAEVYNEWTDGTIASALDGGGNVLSLTTLNPLGRVVGNVNGVSYYQLSHPDGVTPENGLSLFSNINTGDQIVMMTGSISSLVERAGRVAMSALREGDLRKEQVRGALVIYCAGCMLTVREEMPAVVDSLKEALGDVPLLGLFTFGEQGCFIGGENRHGNLMISVTLLAD